MIIKNASVYTEDGCFEEKDIYIAGDKFCDENGKEYDGVVKIIRMWTHYENVR